MLSGSGLPPKVSVILAAYNWSAALRCSIPSVLEQTFGDFELLVIGDHCTDDSAEVVASFGDPRIQWHNLPDRCGSQSGPNNFALGLARGEFVAYLGHDDVWHPDHLQRLLSVLESSNARIGCAICLMYGPRGSRMQGVSGVFVEEAWRPDDFFPPSSMMHRRGIVASAGGWPAPDAVQLPVDCELLNRLRTAGELVVSSRRLTVFKFNSAWRRNSYRKRDTSEQQAVLERLRKDKHACVEEEWAAVLQAVREKRLIDIRIPKAAAGGYTNAYKRFRGLEDDALVPLTEPRRMLPETSFEGMEWYDVEKHPEFGAFRWSGPSPAATVTLPYAPSGVFTVGIQLLNWFGADLTEEVRLFVNSAPVEFTVDESESPKAFLSAQVDLREAPQGIEVQIAASRMRCPYFLSNGESTDHRWLGVCLNWVEVAPVSQAAQGGDGV